MKKQIKEAKEQKRAMRLKLAEQSSDVPTEGRASTPAAEEGEDDLFTVKAVQEWDKEAVGEEVRSSESNEVLELPQKKSKKAKPLRIRSDGTAKLSVAGKPLQALPTVMKFDEEGHVMAEKRGRLDVERMDTSRSMELDEEEVEAYRRRVRARLEMNLELDKQREKERVQRKHKDMRQRLRGDRSDVENAVLLGPSFGGDGDNQSEELSYADESRSEVESESRYSVEVSSDGGGDETALGELEAMEREAMRRLE